MINKQNILIATAIAAIFGILLVVYAMFNKPETYPQMTQITASDHIKWSNAKKNVLVEYSDFFCPACKLFNESLSQLESSQSSEFKTTQKITFVYRHLPIHDQSYLTAYAAEAAASQGKYYPMVDLIFKNQEKLSQSSDLKGDLIKLAVELKLNTDKFSQDLDAKKIKEKVQADQNSGTKAGISSTPTFFLNGKKLEFGTMDEFKQILRQVTNSSS